MDPQPLKGLRVVGAASLVPPHAGDRPSQRTGLGFDFADYRRRRPGDPLTHMDWRRYLISSRVQPRPDEFIREFYTDLSSRLAVIVDASGSMATYPEDAKFTQSLLAAEVVARLAVMNNEMADVLVVGGESRGAIASWEQLATVGDIEAMALDFATLEAGGGTDSEGFAEALEGLAPRFGVAVLITDAIFGTAELPDILFRLSERASRVHVVQLLGRKEWEPARDGEDVEVVDIESRASKEVAFDLKGYQARLEEHMTEVREACARLEVNCLQMKSHDSLGLPDLIEEMLQGEVVEEIA